MKNEVYSWRVTSELKTALESAARRRKVSVGAVLEEAARGWLTDSQAGLGNDEAGQARLHAAAERFIGVLAGGDRHRSEKVRLGVRERLRRKHDRSRAD
jgi:hypothetical protein